MAHEDGEERTLAMTLGDAGYLIDRLGEDCAPLQFVRELTQNSLESGAKLIRWDVDDRSSAEGAVKLCIVDDGSGMTGDEMREYINKLSSSSREQSHHSNFGVGAKIAAATRNHEGLLYLSWREGRGEMVHLWRDPTSASYGLRQFELEEGRFTHVAQLDDQAKPDMIETSGTKVVLLGNEPDQDTTKPPPGTPNPSKWLAKYLNTRYFRFPDDVKVQVRETWEETETDPHGAERRRTLRGMKSFLDEQSSSHGEVPLSGAVARWWVLTEDDARIRRAGAFFEVNGHVAALYQDELYELTPFNAGGRNRLQQFGVIFGGKRVVIYVEPTIVDGMAPNTARTVLLKDNEELPWTQWEAEFRARIPADIVELEEQVIAGSASSNHQDSIKERLKAIRDLYRLRRYRPTRNGSTNVSDDRVPGGTPKTDDGTPRTGSGKAGGKGGRAGAAYAPYIDPKGDPADDTDPRDKDPETQWITRADKTRQAGQLEDRAAEYVQTSNKLLINGDFRVFTDMVDHYVRLYGEGTGEATRLAIQDVVREWFEQTLVETVLGAQGLRDEQHWTKDEIQRLWSSESLTAAVMPRYHVNLAIKRGLGTKIGSLTKQPQAQAA